MLVITTWNKEQPAPSMLVLRVAGYSAYKSASCRLVCDRKTAQPVDVGSDLNLTTLTLSTAVEIPLYFQDERRGYYPAAGPAAGSFWEVPQCSHFNIQSWTIRFGWLTSVLTSLSGTPCRSQPGGDRSSPGAVRSRRAAGWLALAKHAYRSHLVVLQVINLYIG